MSVIVMGMEMPKSCTDCSLFRESAYGFGYCKGKTIAFGAEDSEWIDATRPNWCPLRPLPEKHGRLIDADKAGQIMLNRAHKEGRPEYENSAIMISDMETIVEAEGEDD